MKAIKIIGIRIGSPVLGFYARDEEETKIICLAIQDKGGIPLVTTVDVPDNFDKFVLKKKTKLEKLAAVSPN
jgi:hypothetical protein